MTGIASPTASQIVTETEIASLMANKVEAETGIVSLMATGIANPMANKAATGIASPMASKVAIEIANPTVSKVVASSVIALSLTKWKYARFTANKALKETTHPAISI
jgi:hypothetical protein